MIKYFARIQETLADWIDAKTRDAEAAASNWKQPLLVFRLWLMIVMCNSGQQCCVKDVFSILK